MFESIGARQGRCPAITQPMRLQADGAGSLYSEIYQRYYRSKRYLDIEGLLARILPAVSFLRC